MSALIEKYYELKKVKKEKFTFVKIDLPTLERVTIDNTRYYKVKDGDDFIKLVSITSVISHYNKEIFVRWRKKVGEDAANRITQRATSRGTDTHTLIENYLLNRELPEVQPLSKILFNIAKDELNRINNIHCLEGSLYSKILGVAGTTDCIAEHDGELSVIDFKTAEKPKPLEWIEHYFVQAMFYAMAYYEMTGKKVKKLVIIMTCENGECVTYQERDLSKYMRLVYDYTQKYVNDKLQLISNSYK